MRTPQKHATFININEMVNKFLGWKLPKSFSPDAGISFTKELHGHTFEPSGTNLFTAKQATEMFDYCVDYQSDFDLQATAVRIRRLLKSLNLSDPSNGNDNDLMRCLFSLLGQICIKVELL